MNWIAGWSKRIKFTIDHTKIDETLFNFPILINLDTTCSGVFNELGNNYKRILITDFSLGGTLYCEIVTWDVATQSAQIWVKVPEVKSYTDTEIYLFYDITQIDNTEYVGDVGDLCSQNVWDTNYEAVYHMSQGPIWAFSSVVLYEGEVSGLGNVGQVANASRAFTAATTVGLTKDNGALAIYLKVSDPSMCAWTTGAKSDLEITSAGTSDDMEVYYPFGSDPYNIRDQISTTYKKFIIPLSYFVPQGTTIINLSVINYIRWFCQAQIGTLTVYWKDPEIVPWPAVKDSTSNKNHGTSNVSMSDTNLVNGVVGKALLFDGVDDGINCNFSTNFDTCTLETIFYAESKPSGNIGMLLNKNSYTATANTDFPTTLQVNNIGTVELALDSGNDTLVDVTLSSTNNYLNAFIYAAGINEYNKASRLFINTTSVSNSISINTSDNTRNWYIGKASYSSGAGATTNQFKGIIDEVRISKIARSAAWLKATYYTCFDNIVIKDTEITVPNDSLSYVNKLKLTIPKGYISDTLYNFPVLVNISSSSGFNKENISPLFNSLESSARRKKIAITDSTGVAQCFVEIENWSHSERSAQLWVKVPIVSSLEDTVLYLYYDKEVADNLFFVGDVGSTVGQSIWDSNFIAVYHMNQEPVTGSNCILDSTINNNQGMPTGTFSSSSLTTIPTGKAIYFNGSNNYVNIGDLPTTILHDTLEVIFKNATKGTNDSMCLVTDSYPATTSNIEKTLYINCATGYKMDGGFFNTPTWYLITPSTIAVNDNKIHYAALSYNNVNLVLHLDKDIYSTPQTVAVKSNTGEWKIGSRWDASGGWFEGVIKEVRISKVARSDAWLQASQYSSLDNLIIYTLPEKTAGWLKTYEDGVLSPWAKRIKLEIDGTKIESPLTNFPVLLNLGASSGVAFTDISSIFKQIPLPSKLEDFFIQEDGSAPDPIMWTPTVAVLGLIEIRNNTLELTVTDTSADWKSIQLKLNYQPDGDFDVEMEFNEFELDADHYTQIYAQPVDNTWHMAVGPRYYSGMMIYTSYHSIGGANVDNSGTVFTTAGFVRLVRIGNTGYMYRKTSEADPWILTLTISNIGVGTTNIYINHMKRTSSEASFKSRILNFKINSGIMLWKDDPSKYMIAVTSEDGITQLPVEIERWSVQEESAQLWTKVPNIKSTENTTLYLYYDLDKSDNTNYVGQAGTSTAQAVWDDNYLAVLHLSQDPSGGTVPESANSSSFTIYGSMTSSNIMSMAVGKGTYFDGVNDYLSRTDLINLGKNDLYATVEFVFTTPFVITTDRPTISIGNAWLTGGAGGVAQYAVQNQASTPYADYLTTSTYGLNDLNYYAFSSNGANNPRLLKINSNQQSFNLNRVYTDANFKTVDIGRNHNYTYSTAFYSSTVREVRISSVARSASWLQATYQSNLDNLIYYTDPETYVEIPEDTYTYQGFIKEKNVPVIRTVLLYERSTGLLKDSTTSRADGSYLLETNSNTEHFMVVLDDIENYKYTPLIKDRLLPNGE